MPTTDVTKNLLVQLEKDLLLCAMNMLCLILYVICQVIGGCVWSHVRLGCHNIQISYDGIWFPDNYYILNKFLIKDQVFNQF